ncbi:MAG: hypothetical protein AB7S38_28505 [Vulcanimicrobiota bacterium]
MRVELVATRDALKQGEVALAQVEAAFEKMGVRLGDVQHGLPRRPARPDRHGTRSGRDAKGLAEANRGISTNRHNQADSSRRFDNFLARFDEVTEMLVES